MTPTDFPESNVVIGPPKGMTEEQVASIHACHGQVKGGVNDGMPITIVAWKPSDWELEQLKSGHPVFIDFFGGIPPHVLTTDIQCLIGE